MKKIISLGVLLISFSLASFCQIQRTIVPKAKKDSGSSVSNEMQGDDKMGRKEMMKELNLTRQQKVKLKEAMQDIKAKKAALDADTTLSAPARQQKNRELRKQQAEKMNAILDETQREKLKELRLDKKDMKKEGAEDDN